MHLKWVVRWASRVGVLVLGGGAIGAHAEGHAPSTLLGVEEATLAAPDAAANDSFGSSVALSADGSRALVGAPGDDTSAGINAGSARVFVRSGESWIEEAILLPTVAAAHLQFGHSVSLSSDGSRAVVGAVGDVARVFLRTGSTWSQEAALVGSAETLRESLAWSVSLSADGTRALVGAHMAFEVGLARVFVRNGNTWNEEAVLLRSGPLAGDQFGWSVSLSGDGTRALIGAIFDDTSAGTNAGSARVFARQGASWTEEATLLAAGAAAFDNFGNSVSLSFDGGRALVGAYFGDTPAGADAGSARVFVRSGSAWSEEATLTASGGAFSDNFGTSVSLSFDGGRALIGAYADDTVAGTDAGSMSVFVRSPGGWNEEATLLASGAAVNDRFGFAVSLSGDGSRAVGGAYLDDTTSADTGTARVFTLPPFTGPSCAAGTDCASGFCVDGLCCATACGGGALDCQACSIAAGGSVDGTCGPLAAHAAPSVTCRASVGGCDLAESCSSTSITCPANTLASVGTICRPSAANCDITESCDGVGAACPADKFVAAGTVCSPSSCASQTETWAAACTGSGPSCPSSVVAACAPYTCGATACNLSCTTDAGCNATAYCSAMNACQAKLLPGASCTRAAECSKNACTNGVCAAAPLPVPLFGGVGGAIGLGLMLMLLGLLILGVAAARVTIQDD